jgi:hypothetical protein
MRKAAIRFNERTAVVWSTKVRSLKSSEVLVYDGSSSLIQTNDEEIATRQKWLSVSEYDDQTRQEIDALWAKVEKENMWFMLGARVNKHTVIAHTEDRWAVVKDGEAEEQCTEGELLKSIQKHEDKVKWTSVEAKRDARSMERVIGGRWARIKTAATAAARAIHAAMRLSPRTTDTTRRATARSRN